MSETVQLKQLTKAKLHNDTFRGYDHRPVTQEGTWYEEENLCSDKYPLATVRRNRERVEAVDGNIVQSVIAMCGKEHLVILDDEGMIHCNGEVQQLLDYVDRVWVRPASRAELADLEAAADYFGVGTQTMVYEARVPEGNTEPLLGWWLPDGTWTVNLQAAGIVYQTGYSPSVGDTITVEVERQMSPYAAVPRQLVSMGAYVVIFPDAKYINVVKLAAGQALVADEDYGDLGHKVTTVFDAMGTGGDQIELTLCDLNGTAYTNVTASDTEPATQSGYWLDTRGSMQLLEWSAAATTWVAIPTTYVKIRATGSTKIGEGFRAGDGVQLTASPLISQVKGVGLLNRAQVLHAVAEDGSWVVVTGVCEFATVNTELTMERKVPALDYVCECGNRLWGCHYGPGADGEILNEIYASKLGDFKNWNVFEGISTDSYVASRGSDGPYTGAAVLGGNPLFFKEETLEKVFPSASGAHQINTVSLDGVQAGCSRSMVVIDDALYYKSRGGVMRYTGSLPVLVSPQFGDVQYAGALAGRRGKLYYIAMRSIVDNRMHLFVLDTQTGIWNKEDCPFTGLTECMCPWDGSLYYCVGGELWRFGTGSNSMGVHWYAETNVLGLDVAQHKYIGRINLRYAMEQAATARVLIMYDNSGEWITKERLRGTRIRSGAMCIWPRRCDTFRLRLEGTGGFTLYSLTMDRERGSDVW